MNKNLEKQVLTEFLNDFTDNFSFAASGFSEGFATNITDYHLGCPTEDCLFVVTLFALDEKET